MKFVLLRGRRAADASWGTERRFWRLFIFPDTRSLVMDALNLDANTHSGLSVSGRVHCEMKGQRQHHRFLWLDRARLLGDGY